MASSSSAERSESNQFLAFCKKTAQTETFWSGPVRSVCKICLFNTSRRVFILKFIYYKDFFFLFEHFLTKQQLNGLKKPINLSFQKEAETY